MKEIVFLVNPFGTKPYSQQASGSGIPPQQDLQCEALDDPTTIWTNIKHQTQRSPLSTPATE